MRRVFGLVATLTLAASVLAPAAVRATTPGESGRIAFVVEGEAIKVIEPDGTGEAEVVPGDAVADQSRDFPAWSPDGTRIAFVRSVDDNEDIYLMDADGSNVVRLTRHAATDTYPAWSPSGTRIAFASKRSGRFQVYVISIEGGKTHRVTPGFRTATVPDWSPDGRRIALSGSADGTGVGIHTVRPDGTGRKRLTADGGFSVSWAPGGRRLAYEASRSRVDLGAARIFIVRRDGSGRQTVPVALNCDDECYMAHPAWSPDGQEIAFVKTTEIDLMSALAVVDLDTGIERTLTEEHAGRLWGLSWQAL